MVVIFEVISEECKEIFQAFLFIRTVLTEREVFSVN